MWFLVTCLQSLMHYRHRCNGCWGGNNFILFSEFQHGAVHFILHGVTGPLHSTRSNWWTTQYEFLTSSKQPSKWPYSVCVLLCILLVFTSLHAFAAVPRKIHGLPLNHHLLALPCTQKFEHSVWKNIHARFEVHSYYGSWDISVLKQKFGKCAKCPLFSNPVTYG